MYTLITIFYVSLAGMIAMVVLKRHENKTGRPNLVSRAGAGTDQLFQSVYGSTKHGLSYVNRKTFTAIGQWIAFHILKAVRGVYVSVKDRFISHPQGKKLIDAVRGRGDVTEHGASFFLRQIAEDGKPKP
jgi:hypothetical protein